MSEILPAIVERRWTRYSSPPPRRTHWINARAKVIGLLTVLLSVCAGVAAGFFAWWQPLARPLWLTIAVARDDNTTPARAVAVAGDARALRELAGNRSARVFHHEGLTRRQIEQSLATLREMRLDTPVVVFVSAAATVSPAGEVVLFPSDVDPREPDAGLPLANLLAALSSTGRGERLLLLDLVPVENAPPEIPAASDLAGSLDQLLRKSIAPHLSIVTACSPGEGSYLVPGHDRTVFGYFIDRGLQGAADGNGANGQCNGRITVRELTSYLQTSLPAFTRSTRDAHQSPQTYGPAADFELNAVGIHPILPVLDTAEPSPLPKWLQAAWELHDQAVQSGQYGVDLDGFMQWETKLLLADAASLYGSDDLLLQSLQTSLESPAQGWRTTAPSVNSSATDISPQLVSDIQRYLAETAQQVALAPADKAKASEVSALADFNKSHPKMDATPLAAAALEAASLDLQLTAASVQRLRALLAAQSPLPRGDALSLLNKLDEFSKNWPGTDWSPEGAQLLARIARNWDLLAQQSAAWPWTGELLRTTWNERVTGEVLFAARGFAPQSAALVALRQADENCRQLLDTTTRLDAARRLQTEALWLLPRHIDLCPSPARRAEWLAASDALAELNLALASPSTPPVDMASLQCTVAQIAQRTATLQERLANLRAQYASAAVASAVKDCAQSKDMATALTTAERLLASPLLKLSDRQLLRNAYLRAANRTNDRALTVTDLPTTTALVSTPHAPQRNQPDISTSWKHVLATLAKTATADSSQTNWSSWFAMAQRYRAAQWQHTMRIGSVNDNVTTIWTADGVEVLGPLVCPRLTPQQPRATLNIAWQPHSDALENIQIRAISPSDRLTVIPRQTSVKRNQPVELDVTWSPPPAGPVAEPLLGFVVVLETAAAPHFALVSLADNEQAQQVEIFISSARDKLRQVEDNVMLHPNAAPLAHYVFLQNTTATPQSVALEILGTPLTATAALGPFELKRIDLAPTAEKSPLPLTSLALRVTDSASHRTLGEREFALNVADASQLLQASAGRIDNDAVRGVIAQLAVQALAPLSDAVLVELELLPAAGNPLRVQGGRLRGSVEPGAAPLQLSAAGIAIAPGMPLCCALTIDGVHRAITLEGIAPPPGASAALTAQTGPAVTLSGSGVSPPVATYILEVASQNAPPDAKTDLQLMSVGSTEGTPVLTRQIAARPATSTTWQASTPPGGIALAATQSAPRETFDTTGLVGRFQWQSTLLAASGERLASTTLPVVFDNSPPVAGRFVKLPPTAAKQTKLTLQAAAWDDLSSVANISYFVGEPVENKPPVTAKLISAQPAVTGDGPWTAEMVTPDNVGPLRITAQFTNGAGLVSFVTATIEIVVTALTPTGNLRGVVLEGGRPQAKLPVTLYNAANAEIAKTQTGADGAFSFYDLAPGDYHTVSQKDVSQRRGQAKATIVANETATATINLGL